MACPLLTVRTMVKKALFTVMIAVLGTAAVGCKDSSSAGSVPGRVIEVTANDEGFNPSTVQVAKGEDVTFKFTRTSDKTCATEVIFPEIGIDKKLPLNEPVTFKVPTDQARTLTFQCGMGMYKSAVVIN